MVSNENTIMKKNKKKKEVDIFKKIEEEQPALIVNELPDMNDESVKERIYNMLLDERLVMIKISEGYKPIRFGEIMCVEGDNEKIVYYISEQKPVVSPIPISVLMESNVSEVLVKLLPVNDTCLVNSDYVTGLGNDFVEVDGKRFALDEDKKDKLFKRLLIIGRPE